MNILTRISDSERDLIRVIVDVVTEIRLGEDEARDRGMSVVSPFVVVRRTWELSDEYAFPRWEMTTRFRLRLRSDPLPIEGDKAFWPKLMIQLRVLRRPLSICGACWCAAVYSSESMV
jgi:hypothetical protein